MPTTVFADIGHSDIKILAQSGVEFKVPNGFLQLSAVQWNNVIAHAPDGKPGPDFLVVNGTPYAFGDSARSMGIVRTLTGASRYTPDYYGVLASYAMFMALGENSVVSYVGSHPPRDVAYRSDLMASVIKSWSIYCDNKHYIIDVVEGNAFDEGIGSWAYRFLSKRGNKIIDPQIARGRILVIDIGGGTISFLGIRNGRADYGVQFSLDTGINDVLTQFESLVRSEYHKEFKNTVSISHYLWGSALRSGVFAGGGYTFNVEAIAERALHPVLQQIHDTVQSRAGGLLNWDTILCTGGGTGLLSERLVETLEHGNIIYPSELSTIEFANVRGFERLTAVARS